MTQQDLEFLSEYTEKLIAAVVEQTALQLGAECDIDALIKAVSQQIEKSIYNSQEINCCEHGDHPAPDGQRFCSDECLKCEHDIKLCAGCAQEEKG
jgi:hypothetical protein